MTTLLSPNRRPHSVLDIYPSSAMNPWSHEIEKEVCLVKNSFLQTESLGRESQILLNHLESIYQKCKQDNWDGYGASPIRWETYEKALDFIRTYPNPWPKPEISVDPDGDIVFEWFFGKENVVSFSISGEGFIHYMAVYRTAHSHGTEVFTSEIPETPRLLLQRCLQGKK